MTDVAQEPKSRKEKSLEVLAVVLTALLVVLLLILLLLVPRIAGPTYEPVAGITPLRVLYGPGVGKEPFFDGPMGSAYGRNGRVYVADTGNNRVVVFDVDGRYLFQWGGLGIAKPAIGVKPSWKPGLFNYPTDLATDANGDVYVADFRNDQIQVFDADGKFIRAFPDRNKPVGKGASGQGGRGVAVTSLDVSGDRLFATDRYQIIEFDTDGKFIRQFGKPGTGPADLDYPNGIALDLDSKLIVSDSNHNRVLAFSDDGKLLWSAGRPASNESSRSAPVLEIPRGLTTTARGRLVVADAMASHLVMLSDAGKVLEVLGERGNAPGQLNYPTDVDWRGGRLVIAEKGNNRVQIVKLAEE